MKDAARDALVSRLSDYECVVEVGIGRRVGLARALVATGTAVTATDIQPRAVPDGVTFVRDDVTDPRRGLYADADAIYARNLPPELHRPTRDLAHDVGAECLFTTLGGDQPTVPVSRETVPGDTLFRAECA